MRNNDEIIELIQQQINEKQISMSELARRVGLAKSTLSRYLNKSREFPLNHADVFARALNIKPEYLLGIEPTESPIDLKDVLNRTVAFDGHTLDENDAELIKSLLENMVKNKD